MYETGTPERKSIEGFVIGKDLTGIFRNDVEVGHRNMVNNFLVQPLTVFMSSFALFSCTVRELVRTGPCTKLKLLVVASSRPFVIIVTSNRAMYYGKVIVHDMNHCPLRVS